MCDCNKLEIRILEGKYKHLEELLEEYEKLEQINKCLIEAYMCEILRLKEQLLKIQEQTDTIKPAVCLDLCYRSLSWCRASTIAPER